MQWKELENMYARQFAVDTGRGIRRTVQGLQGAYYRSNGCIPKSDEHGNIIFDNNDEVVTLGPPSRCVTSPTRLALLGRYPERAIEYSWVLPEDKGKVWDLGTSTKSLVQLLV